MPQSSKAREGKILKLLSDVFSRPVDIVTGLYNIIHSFDKVIFLLEIADAKSVTDSQLLKTCKSKQPQE